MATIRSLLAVVVLAGVTVACGSSSAAPAPTVRVTTAPVVATPATTLALGPGGGVCQPVGDGLAFTTTWSSCEQARSIGKQLAVSLGLATPAGAELVFTVICAGIQGSTKMTYHYAEDLDLARQLDSLGVCPGDLSMLVRVFD